MTIEEAELFMKSLETLSKLQQLRAVWKMIKTQNNKNSLVKTSRWLKWCMRNREYIFNDNERLTELLNDESNADEEIEAHIVMIELNK